MRSDHDTSAQARLVRDLVRSESNGGLLALLAALVAIIWANTNADSYRHLQHLMIGPLNVEHWAADGGLTLFFFVAGLELKREFVSGTLRDPRTAAIPVTAACCGVAVPALLFVLVNLNGPNLHGWAIGSPTDIAFALAVLAVVGRRAPVSLRVFLLTLAVVDDVIVITIIAVAYSGSLHGWWLAGAGLLIATYAVLVRHTPALIPLLVPLAVGAWWCTLHSGIHATVAGVVLALLTPVSERLEHALAPWSATLAVPLFALMSAGVSLQGVGPFDARVFWGVFIGLVLGKPLGIGVGALAASRLTRTPWDGAAGSMRDLLGVGLLGGIGFTVALLVSDLAFTDSRIVDAKAAVLIASTTSAALGALVLTLGSRRDKPSTVGSEPRPMRGA